jgi:hypothetical protein
MEKVFNFRMFQAYFKLFFTRLERYNFGLYYVMSGPALAHCFHCHSQSDPIARDYFQSKLYIIYIITPSRRFLHPLVQFLISPSTVTKRRDVMFLSGIKFEGIYVVRFW